jgi:hypothetical protein
VAQGPAVVAVFRVGKILVALASKMFSRTCSVAAAEPALAVAEVLGRSAEPT